MQPKRPLVNPKQARSDLYRADLDEIQQSGVCPFCPENFAWHRKPILHRADGWLITESSHPYEHAKHHFLLIGDAHKVEFSELDARDWAAVQALTAWVRERYNLPGAGLCLRFGDSEHTGASVAHLHFHLITPDRNADDEITPVWFPVG